MTRILLIDDHSLFREAIARLLGREEDFEIVGECATVDEGIAVLQNSEVDVVLLDINLGVQQGGAFLPLARDAGFKGKILVVTAGVSRLEAERLVERGCAGIILKQERPEVLIEHIRAITGAHGTAAAPSPLPETLGMAGADEPPTFTARERQVLRAVFAGQTNKEVAFKLGVSEPLVKAVLQQLFSKTGVRTRSQLVRIALERHWKELEGQSD
ncbi:MAG: Two component transcriptional regulator, LuxR family [Bryobacterales bacterium]|nr:Two component transcriptional regulator, LuxR family [Bryobacterales bacterium]